MIKKSLSILLLLIFTFKLAGVFIVFKIQQTSIRKELKHQIKAGIPESDLHPFVFSIAEYNALEWVRKDIEFRLNHEMFDIVKTEIVGGQYLLLCVNDKEESNLFAHLENAILNRLNRESNTPDKPLNKVIKLYKLVYLKFDKSVLLSRYGNGNCIHFADTANLYASLFPETVSPPPDQV